MNSWFFINLWPPYTRLSIWDEKEHAWRDESTIATIIVITWNGFPGTAPIHERCKDYVWSAFKCTLLIMCDPDIFSTCNFWSRASSKLIMIIEHKCKKLKLMLLDESSMHSLQSNLIKQQNHRVAPSWFWEKKIAVLSVKTTVILSVRSDTEYMTKLTVKMSFQFC